MYQIGIPSYRRSNNCKTLLTLHKCKIPKELINVFVVEEEFDLYLSTLNKDYYNKLVVGEHTLVKQREFIENYYPVSTNLIFMDDDIDDVMYGTYDTLNDFFNEAFKTCHDNSSFIWGIYPVNNSFFFKKQPALSVSLKFIIGCLYGIITRENAPKLQITSKHDGNKDDVERSILYYLRDKIVLRFNHVTIKTKFYKKNEGLGGLEERKDFMMNSAIELNKEYPHLTRIKIRKNGLYEIQFKR